MDIEIDKFLKIKTTGRDDSISNFTNYPYEATPYSVLEKLYESGYIKKNDKIIDFGCGKGRVDFYLTFYTKCKMIGIEYDKRLFMDAINNKQNMNVYKRIEFINVEASVYEIPKDITKCYFFNPFSVEVLAKVIHNLKSINKPIHLFFYYPSDKYINYLDTLDNIELIDKISFQELFKSSDKSEEILIYKLN